MTCNEKELLTYLVQTLLDEHTSPIIKEMPSSIDGLRHLLRCLMNIRSDMPIAQEWLQLQDRELAIQKSEKGIITLDHLFPPKCNSSITLWQGDITRLQIDAIVNAANSKLLGCFVPGHNCIDNVIHSAAGIQLRAVCGKLMKNQGTDEKTGSAKLTEAYNLPSKYVIHTVGPIVTGNHPTKEDCELLASCYRQCLLLADKHRLESIAFCCISTGVFRFPALCAAEIAIQTVKKYLSDYPNRNIQRIIFNVFKDEDFVIYQELLKQ